jgi:hypothetical protein
MKKESRINCNKYYARAHDPYANMYHANNYQGGGGMFAFTVRPFDDGKAIGLRY